MFCAAALKPSSELHDELKLLKLKHKLYMWRKSEDFLWFKASASCVLIGQTGGWSERVGVGAGDVYIHIENNLMTASLKHRKEIS